MALATAPSDVLDERRIDEHLSEARARTSRFIMVWSLVVNAIWWTTDVLAMDGIPGAVEAFVTLRLWIIGSALLVLCILRGQVRLEGARLWACVAVWCAQYGLLAATLATLGDFSEPWFHCLYPLLIAPSLLPLGLSRRAVVTTLMGASLLLGFLLVRPEATESTYFGMTLGYLSFSVGVGIAFGHRHERVERESFERRLTIERDAELIAQQREDLRVLVDERTFELRMLAEHLDQAGEAERQRIARELHDDLGQSVSALRLSLATALRRFARDPASIAANLTDIDDLVGRVADGTRDAVTRLRPRILDDLGLVSAAEWLVRTTARHSGLQVELEVAGDLSPLAPNEDATEGRAATPEATAAFRILQEALTNAVKHARASRITVGLRAEGDTLHLQVSDDGVGLRGTRGSGMGLVSMRERARALGGQLTVGSTNDEGAVVQCTLPLGRRSGGPSRTAGQAPA